MKIMRRDPFLRTFFSPIVWDDEDRWPELTMTDGIDMFEKDGHVVVKAAVPGVRSENIDITYEDGVLTISGKTEEKEEEKSHKQVVYKKERVSSFNYTTTLPRPVKQSELFADVEDGVVTIKAPIAEEAKPHKVKVVSTKK